MQKLTQYNCGGKVWLPGAQGKCQVQALRFLQPGCCILVPVFPRVSGAGSTHIERAEGNGRWLEQRDTCRKRGLLNNLYLGHRVNQLVMIKALMED